MRCPELSLTVLAILSDIFARYRSLVTYEDKSSLCYERVVESRHVGVKQAQYTADGVQSNP